MTLIHMSQLTKVYKTGAVEVPALKGIDVSIERGEFLAIMGPSGSGKSTLMNIVGCLDVPTAGDYYLDGRDVSKLGFDDRADVRNRKIGFVFQGFNLLPRITALKNVELPLVYSGVKTSERAKIAQEVLELVGLGDRAHHLPSELSGGQQQRVAIARSLVNSPEIILADEPTGNLDTRTSQEIMAVFQKLNQTRNITFIIVTHNAEIGAVTQRNILLKDGEIQADQQNVV